MTLSGKQPAVTFLDQNLSFTILIDQYRLHTTQNGMTSILP